MQGDTAEEDFEEGLPTAKSPPPEPAADTLIPPPPGFGSSDESQDEDHEVRGSNSGGDYWTQTGFEESRSLVQLPPAEADLVPAPRCIGTAEEYGMETPGAHEGIEEDSCHEGSGEGC